MAKFRPQRISCVRDWPRIRRDLATGSTGKHRAGAPCRLDVPHNVGSARLNLRVETPIPLPMPRASPTSSDRASPLASVGTGPGEPAAADVPGLVARALELQNADTPAAHALARRALALAEADSSDQGLAQHALGMIECLLGRIAPGRELLQQATQTLHRHGPALAECRAWRDHGSVLTVLSGDVKAGVEAFQRALALAEALGDPIEQGTILARMGPGLSRAGHGAEALRVLQRAIELLARGPDRAAHASALDNLGFLLNQEQDYARAEPILRAERTLRDPVGERLRTVNCEVNLAVALAGTGQAIEARQLIDSIAARLDPETDCYQWADYLMSAGRVCLLLDDPDRARAYLREGLLAARRHALESIEIDVLRQLAVAEERCGDLAAALATERALREAERAWLDEQTASRVQVLEAGVELAAKRAENKALESARAELEQRVAERTAALAEQMREREAAQELARFWADHDWLTRLPNRRQLQARLELELARAQDEGSELGVLFVDLDGFKAVNDAHGHLAGDHVLRLTARRLLRKVPERAIVTRFGGDEFVVLLPGLSTAGVAAATAQRLRAAVLAPLKLERRRFKLSCSIGVAIGPRDANTADELLRRADRAMLEAKRAGRNQVCELDTRAQQRLDRRGRLRRELGHAIAAGWLSAAYQPIWDARRQGLSGVELLARWHDAELGWVAPTEFIPVAEESGLIDALGLWAIGQAVQAVQALRAAGKWPRLGPGGMRMSVNLSTVQLANPMLVEDLVHAVAKAGGEPGWIALEVTESVQLAEDPGTQARLRRLREAGFSLLIDDFGAGYSSFSALARLAFDGLKIDRGLVAAALRVGERSALTGSIIAMARRLGLDVVAEGVETIEQASLLAQQGCEVLQGFGIARPMPLEELIRWPPQPPQPQPPVLALLSPAGGA